MDSCHGHTVVVQSFGQGLISLTSQKLAGWQESDACHPVKHRRAS